MAKDKNIGDDNLLDLLNHNKHYTARINFMKDHQYSIHDQEEFEKYMKIERQLKAIEDCIKFLEPVQKKIIEELYSKGYSIRKIAKDSYLSRGAIFHQKGLAIKFIKDILGNKLTKI